MSRHTRKQMTNVDEEKVGGKQREESAEPTLSPLSLEGVPPQTNVGLRQQAALNLQQQGGNQQAQRLIQRAVPSVQRENPFFGFGRVRSSSPDMNEVNWASAGRSFGTAVEIGSNLSPLTMNLPSQAPAAPPRPRPEPDWSRPPDCNPGHHTRPEPFLDPNAVSIFETMERQDAWNAFKQVVGTTETSYNNLVPLNNNYYNAQRDLTLQRPEMGLTPYRPNEGGDLSSLVDQQVVPRTGGRGRTVDSLFEHDENGMAGTNLNWNASDQRGVDRAKRSPEVEQAVLAAQSADAAVNSAVDHVRTQVGEVETAANGVTLAESQLQLAQAENERERSQADLDRLTAERDAVKKDVKDLLGIVKGITALVGAATMGATPGLTMGNAPGPANDIVGIIADRMVDSAYGERITAARERLTNSIGRVQNSRLLVATNQLMVAHSNLETKMLALQEARNAVAQPLINRRAAYSSLAQVAGQASGGSAESRARISGAVAAIPLIEVVVSRLEGMRSVLSSAANLPYSQASGVGYGMAEYHGQNAALSNFMYALGVVYGMNSQFTGVQQFWQARLASARSIVTQLSGLTTPAPASP